MVRLAVLTVALALALPACGDEDEPEPVAPPEPAESSPSSDEPDTAAAEQEFIQDADAICEDLNREADALGDATTYDELAAAAEDAIQLAEGGIADLRTLDPPTSELETRMDQFIAAVEEQTNVIAEVGDAAEAGDGAAIEALKPELVRRRDLKADIAIEAGFSECGTG